MELLSRETRTVFTLHQPIYNMATGYSLPANRLIPVQFAKMQNGFNSNSVATRTTLDGMENGIKENEKGVFYRCTTFRKWNVVLTNSCILVSKESF